MPAKEIIEGKCICGKYYPLKDEAIFHLSWCPQSFAYEKYKEEYKKSKYAS